jgi:hypothetical protein
MAALARQPGIHEQVFDRRNQRYTIAIPAGYVERQPAPVVLEMPARAAVGDVSGPEEAAETAPSNLGLIEEVWPRIEDRLIEDI